MSAGATHGSQRDGARAVRCVVAGRVQSVNYRGATVEQAAALGLRGWVKNLPDGHVEAVAAGPIEALTAFAGWLWEGPPAARVDSVQLEDWTEHVPDGFDVRR